MKHVLIKAGAGLGDRILGTATGLLYARLAGRRPVVDWTDPRYSSDGSNAFTRYFAPRDVGSIAEIPGGASVAPEEWEGRLGDLIADVQSGLPPESRHEHWRHTCIDLTRVDHPEDVVVMWSMRQRIEWLRPHFTGAHSELAGLGTWTILRRVLDTEMRPSAAVANPVEDFRRERLAGGRTVGVHVRYSDRRTNLPAIRRELDRWLAKNDGARVFLATDNLEMRDEFERSYGAVSTPHWYAAPGEPLHRASDRPDPGEVGREALVDLFVLAGCDHVIGDRSSNFCRVAMALTDGGVTDVQPLRARPPAPLLAVWRRVVPGPAAPVAVAAARRWAR